MILLHVDVFLLVGNVVGLKKDLLWCLYSLLASYFTAINLTSMDYNNSG